MNANQKQFLDFIITRVKDGMGVQAAALLKVNFQKQDTGTFDMDDALGLLPKIANLIKPEYLDEVTRIIKQYSSTQEK